jgi:hypothetical protein
MQAIVAGAIVDLAMYLGQKTAPNPLHHPLGISDTKAHNERLANLVHAWAKERGVDIGAGVDDWAQQLSNATEGGPTLRKATDGEVIGEAGARIRAMIDALGEALT